MAIAAVPLVGALFGLGVSVLANALRGRRRNVEQKQEDFQPATYAVQGSFVPLLIGRRRVGAVVGWVGDRTSYPSAPLTTRGKGSRRRTSVQGTSVPHYQENGWHLICVGPATRLHRIYQDGKVLWEGPINSEDDPSGTTTTLETGESFTIYWGEDDQPTNSFLGDAGRVGITSRWPLVCYVVWQNKQLGPSPRWPTIDYEIECEVHEDHLTTGCGSPEPYVTGPPAGPNPAHALAQLLFSKFPHGAGLDAECFEAAAAPPSGCTDGTVVSDETLGTEEAESVIDTEELNGSQTGTVTGTASFVVSAPGWWAFPSSSDSGPYGDSRAINRPAIGLFDETAVGAYSAASFRVYLDDGTTETDLVDETLGAFDDDTVGVFDCWDVELMGYSGSRPMFARINFNTVYVYLEAGTYTPKLDYDVSTAETSWTIDFKVIAQPVTGGTVTPAAGESGFCSFAEECDTLTLPASVYAKDGEEAQEAVGKIMQDHGLFLSWDVTDGEFKLDRLRVPATKTVLAADQVNAPRAEIEVLHIERPVDRLLFQFQDADRQFRETSIGITEAGQADYLEVQRARKVDIATVVNFEAAQVLAERRSQEELGGGVTLRITAGRDARLLRAGDVIEVPGIPQLLRVVEVTRDVNSGQVEINAVPDFYGVPSATYTGPAGGGGGTGGGAGTAPENDLLFRIVEVPALAMGAAAVPTIIVPRLRYDATHLYADVHLSLDNVTYVQLGREQNTALGGTLLDAIDASDAWVIETGPEFTAVGPDVADAQDFSADLPNWRVGRQVAVIGGEFFFVREVVPVSGSTYRLDGLIRARFGSRRATHAIGAEVYVFPDTLLQDFVDAAFLPGQTIYIKTQPYNTTGPVSLAGVTAESAVLRGEGIVPLRPSAGRVTAPFKGVLVYNTGDDIDIEWAYSSLLVPGTGAGMQGAGNATGVSGVQGEFEIRFLTTGDVLERTVTQAGTTYTYTNANIISDFGSEQDIKVQIRNVNGGYRSDPLEFTIAFE